VTGVVIALALVWLIPVAWTLDTSFKSENATIIIPATWAMPKLTFSAYGAVFSATDLGRWYVNSAFVAILVTLLTVITASIAGYALSRRRFRGKTSFYAAILAGIMIPPQALIVPLFREFQTAHLINTYWALTLPQVPAPIAVFIFKKFFDGIPISLEQAAGRRGGLVDRLPADRLAAGPAGHRRRLHLHLRVDLEYLPLAVPGGDEPDDDDHPRRKSAPSSAGSGSSTPSRWPRPYSALCRWSSCSCFLNGRSSRARPAPA
jgi:hypothetical protein